MKSINRVCGNESGTELNKKFKEKFVSYTKKNEKIKKRELSWVLYGSLIPFLHGHCTSIFDNNFYFSEKKKQIKKVTVRFYHYIK